MRRNHVHAASSLAGDDPPSWGKHVSPGKCLSARCQPLRGYARAMGSAGGRGDEPPRGLPDARTPGRPARDQPQRARRPGTPARPIPAPTSRPAGDRRPRRRSSVPAAARRAAVARGPCWGGLPASLCRVAPPCQLTDVGRPGRPAVAGAPSGGPPPPRHCHPVPGRRAVGRRVKVTARRYWTIAAPRLAAAMTGRNVAAPGPSPALPPVTGRSVTGPWGPERGATGPSTALPARGAPPRDGPREGPRRGTGQSAAPPPGPQRGGAPGPG